jgi:hypothetical protein
MHIRAAEVGASKSAQETVNSPEEVAYPGEQGVCYTNNAPQRRAESCCGIQPDHIQNCPIRTATPALQLTQEDGSSVSQSRRRTLPLQSSAPHKQSKMWTWPQGLAAPWGETSCGTFLVKFTLSCLGLCTSSRCGLWWAKIWDSKPPF